MKKIYQQPEMKAIDIQSELFIAVSGGFPKIGGDEGEGDDGGDDVLPGEWTWD